MYDKFLPSLPPPKKILLLPRPLLLTVHILAQLILGVTSVKFYLVINLVDLSKNRNFILFAYSTMTVTQALAFFTDHKQRPLVNSNRSQVSHLIYTPLKKLQHVNTSLLPRLRRHHQTHRNQPKRRNIQ